MEMHPQKCRGFHIKDPQASKQNGDLLTGEKKVQEILYHCFTIVWQLKDLAHPFI